MLTIIKFIILRIIMLEMENKLCPRFVIDSKSYFKCVCVCVWNNWHHAHDYGVR